MKLKKTYVQAFALGCPKQFNDVFILRKYVLPVSPPQQVGQNFHEWAYKFFDYAKWEELQRYKTFEDVQSYLRLFVPKDAVTPLKEAMFNFCGFEAKHFLAVKELGPQFFFPLEREFLIDTPTIETHIDRIDLLFENFISPFEYKLQHAWGEYTFRDIRRELVFYAVALNAVEKYKGRAKFISAYNPLLDKYFFEPVHRNTVAAVIRWIYRMKEAVEKKDFPRRPGGQCRNCPSAEECFLEDERVPLPLI